MIIRRSARKHSIADNDIRAAADSPLLTGPLDDEHPQRVLVLGFDTHTRVLELVVLHYDDGTVAQPGDVAHCHRQKPFADRRRLSDYEPAGIAHASTTSHCAGAKASAVS